jgi:HD-GYP domain-containing protein (c-di-GMP phosphodiesterase class II)
LLWRFVSIYNFGYLSFADIYEALTTWRSYKEPMRPLKALGIMKEEVESEKLDGNIFKAFANSIVRLYE